MSRFDITSRIRAAVDRSEDPHLLIDMVREEQGEHDERLTDLERDVKLLQDAERDRLTRTGVWPIVKAKLDEEAVDWVKWGVRAAFCGFGTAMLSGMAWIITRIIKA